MKLGESINRRVKTRKSGPLIGFYFGGKLFTPGFSFSYIAHRARVSPKLTTGVFFFFLGGIKFYWSWILVEKSSGEKLGCAEWFICIGVRLF